MTSERPPPTPGPLVVELFTSQGCSSCPPADELVARLVAERTVGDRTVVPLAFHVDYWDDLGWADPFARAAWTERQRAYADRLGGRVYTPELVVAGRTDVVGSNVARVISAIAEAPVPAPLAASIEWTAGAARVRATAPPDAAAVVAIYEDGLATDVRRGENAGTALRGDHVVRALVPVATAGHTGTVEIPLDPAWDRLGAVALAQDDQLAIVAAAELAQRPR